MDCATQAVAGMEKNSRDKIRRVSGLPVMLPRCARLGGLDFFTVTVFPPAAGAGLSGCRQSEKLMKTIIANAGMHYFCILSKGVSLLNTILLFSLKDLRMASSQR